MTQPSLIMDGFRGVLRLFPLPGFVMLPHVVKVFHIFEPRYRELVEHALEKDKYVTLVLPKPGWETDYEGSFPIHSMSCLTQIMNHERLEDGRYNIMVRGVCRVRIDQEVLSNTRYRQAQGTPFSDPAIHDENAGLRSELQASVQRWLSKDPEASQQFETLLNSTHSTGMITDIIAFALPLTAEVKQQLLETLDIQDRLKLLLSAMTQLKPREAQPTLTKLTTPDHNPPDFSRN